MTSDRAIRPASALRPKLVFRVGVTGTRSIAPEALERLHTGIELVLQLVHDEIRALKREPRLRDIYEHGPDDDCAVEMRLITPLAEGADRLVADIALQFGYRLLVPLPFTREEYEADFPDTRDAFRDLLKKSDVIELDGARSDATASYEAVGRYVVRNCDLLIGLWNGEPARGRGGTAEIIRFAAGSNLPVWWIDTGEGEPRLIDSLKTFRNKQGGPAGTVAFSLVQDYIRRTLMPPSVAAPERHGAIGRLAAFRDRLTGDEADPLKTYLREPAFSRSTGIWRTHALFFDLLAPVDPRTSDVKPTGSDSYWYKRYCHADLLSAACASKYRSSYVLIFLVALLLIVTSLLGALFSESMKIGIELFFICSIVTIVAANRLERWHERWISYRLLAELCRKQQILAPLGRSLPSAEISRIDAQGIDDESNPAMSRGSWVPWYFQALQRNAPWPEDGSGPAKRHAFALARSLIDEQSAYHRQRGIRTATADLRLAIGDTLFAGSALLLTFSLAILLFRGNPGVAILMETGAGLLSAFSATIVGLRAYSEFSLLARESQRMRSLLNEMSVELDSIDLDAPLASVELGSVSHRLSILMMHDIDGWAQLFRLRTVELT